ncbi:XRE family transcriptional regulator [Pedobacter frigiditerrae]|uniref:XRE family transcriptional regulator n=1 Tax=Pedobacter frigiditerrae TaxID=2530452 RepID=A0A4R0MKW7_9SPHI|nr:helix-turn-helix transcriptional regulator [Pedobacter frigiditerrae]TCC87261.1 XRE family transcriptional regulator [Pedobacter frigiditerrae]
MELGEKIAAERKRKGITQERLAELTNVTVRTIQRIENGNSIPRSFTVSAIAKALDTSYESLIFEAPGNAKNQGTLSEDNIHFLQLLTLSCFSFIFIPIIHFLIPMWLLKRADIKDQKTKTLSRKTIKTQVIWVAATNLLLLLCLCFNIVSAFYLDRIILINFLWPLLLMYFFNAYLLTKDFIKIKRELYTNNVG